MAHTVTLSDEEYAALAALAAREGRSVEALVHATLAERLAGLPVATADQPAATATETASEPLATPTMTQEAFLQMLYREGVISNIPDRQPLSPEEVEERERRARSIGPGKPVSDIVLEDRGPR